MGKIDSRRGLHHLTGLMGDLQFMDKVTKKLPTKRRLKKFTVEMSQAEGRALRHGINWLCENWTETCSVLGEGNVRRLENIGTRVFLKLNPRPKTARRRQRQP